MGNSLLQAAWLGFAHFVTGGHVAAFAVYCRGDAGGCKYQRLAGSRVKQDERDCDQKLLGEMESKVTAVDVDCY